VSFGPLPVVVPSAIVPETGPGEALTGTIEIDVASVPVAAPTLLRITDVTVQASGGASFTLDPSVLSPALGVVRANGSFLIPTLFLRVDDGSTPVDLAVPDVEGTLVFDAEGDVIGLASDFQVESPTAGILSVELVAGVPEPDQALLIAGALTALAIKKEMSR
jgi:hypothetical protein